MTDLFKYHTRCKLGCLGHLCLVLFSIVISVLCLFSLDRLAHPTDVLLFVAIYMFFMFCFISTYSLSKILLGGKVVDIDLFWVVPFGASLFYLI